jgi:hypothetical protein
MITLPHTVIAQPRSSFLLLVQCRMKVDGAFRCTYHSGRLSSPNRHVIVNVYALFCVPAICCLVWKFKNYSFFG